jgi:hypothetical protein
LRPDSPGNAIQAAAAPKAGEPVYRKHVNSAFIGTFLERGLRKAGIDTLVIVGLTTNHCVSTSARMAGNLGFETFVVSDATAAFARAALNGTVRPAEDVHLAALSDIPLEFATVAGTAEILKRVTSRTGGMATSRPLAPSLKQRGIEREDERLEVTRASWIGLEPGIYRTIPSRQIPSRISCSFRFAYPRMRPVRSGFPR